MSINRLPEITFVFIVCLVDFVWKYHFGGERFPTSVVSRQHDNNNRTITGQGSAVATIFTKPRMLCACEVILEYDAYDVLLKCVLPANIKRLCWTRYFPTDVLVMNVIA